MINEKLCRVDCASKLNNSNVNLQTTQYYEILDEIISRHIPLKPGRRRRTRLWLNRNLAVLRNAKRKAARFS